LISNKQIHLLHRCTYRRIAVYSSRTEIDEKFNLHPLSRFQTTNSVPQIMVSSPLSTPMIKPQLNSALTDYGIAGLMPVPNRCWFVYNGSDYRDGQVGWTNSPFFANTYPSNSTCLYLFQFDPGQSVRLTFTTFQTVADSDVAAVGGNHFHHLLHSFTQFHHADYLEVIELLTQVTDAKRLLQQFAMSNAAVRRQVDLTDFPISWRMEEHRKTHSFCGDYIPGPLIPSPDAKALLLAFRTDEAETAVGFQLKFQFLPISQHFLNREGSIVDDWRSAANTSELGGVLHSPGYPSAYPSGINCEWKLSVSQPAQGIMIHFTDLAVEGSFKGGKCKHAVIRIRVGDSVQSAASICGFASTVPAFVTNHTSLTIRYDHTIYH
uniref:CUB domain-containing protein n=1 Tax=Taenia asiatica TaxID=60517 RepID=A0A0R3VUM9_TAEAS